MSSEKSTIISKPMTIMFGLNMLCIGVAISSTAPYVAVVGVGTLGINNSVFASIIAVGSIVSAMLSLLVGYMSDHLRDRRILILIAACIGASGYSIIYSAQSKLTFFLIVGFAAPVGASLAFSQSFAFIRTYYDRRADFIIPVLRTVYATAWVISPPLVGMLASKYSVFIIFLVSAIAYLCLILIWAVIIASKMPCSSEQADGALPNVVKTKVSFLSIFGIVGVVIVTIAMRLVGLSVPLMIVKQLGGTVSDVGVYAGLTAGLEIPFMILWAFIARRLSAELIIGSNALLYGLYSLLMANTHSLKEVYYLQVMNGVAASALLSITISYIQGAIKGRIGLSTSLIDLVGTSANLSSAVIFGAFSTSENYHTVLMAAASAAGIGGATILFSAFGRTRRLIA
ncbi:MFS transporter [Agrobacterium rhizogenes]|nr:MFS transporter [Rhizobium rhizogenes]